MEINLIIGPMKAGKTSSIISVCNKFNAINKKILIINHTLDIQRTNKDNVVKTHDNQFMKALSTNSLIKLIDIQEYKEAEIIIIDESQFFNDLIVFFEDQIKYNENKIFYIYGLSGDVKQQKIGYILDLIPIADSITHLKAFCSICKDCTPAPFTKIDSDVRINQIFISNEHYFPVCRKHI